jgi:hypothetical protein
MGGDPGMDPNMGGDPGMDPMGGDPHMMGDMGMNQDMGQMVPPPGPMPPPQQPLMNGPPQMTKLMRALMRKHQSKFMKRM